MSLYSLFLNNNDRIIHKWVHYFPVYERYFSPFVNKSIVFIEIGVSKGGSLQMWKKYFGPLATIIGIDIDKRCIKYQDDQCVVKIGNQSDSNFLQKIISEYGAPDIVLDDGSHVQEDMYATFQVLYPQLKNNGIYMVEDAHTCYWKDYNGGLLNKNSFIEKSKSLIDELNAFHHMQEDMIPDFTTSTYSIAFYDSIVVFEKMLHKKPYAIKTGSNIQLLTHN